MGEIYLRLGQPPENANWAQNPDGSVEPLEKVNFLDWQASHTEQLLELIVALELTHLAPEDTGLGPDGRFTYVPLNPIEFLAGLKTAAALIEGRRFVDVGCGIGSKLWLARQAGWQVFGIEIKPEYVKVAQRLVPGGMIALADAGEYIDYAAYDLIYMYRPAHDDTMMTGLEQRVVKAMRPGALLWLPGPRSTIPLEPVGHLMWRKP